MSRLGLRSRLFVVIVATVAVVLAALLAVFNLVLNHTLNVNARDLARSRAAAEVASLRFDRGELKAGDVPAGRGADAYLWVFAGPRVLDEPRAAPVLQRAARSLAGASPQFGDVGDTDTRLYAAPVIVHGRRVGTVVAGVSLVPYEETRATALGASLVFGAIALVLVALAARWLLTSSLRPVVLMTRQAARWSERDLEQRFALGPPHDELTELAATLDGLLDRLAASLRHERLFSAELSHELRTPLARILAETEVALRRERDPREYREALELINSSAGQLSRIVDALVTAARYEAGGERATADAAAVAEGAAAACVGLAEERQVALEVTLPSQPLRVGVDADLAERILQPVIENACRYGSHSVRVGVERDRSTVLYAIEDDGPGVGQDEREQIFEPGVRGGAVKARGGNTGAGLGLALARRLARSVDGDVLAEADPAGGRFLVRLPSG
jgi:two-component system, OmpR family, sensor kinase